jgi:cytoskeleton protein RodZ
LTDAVLSIGAALREAREARGLSVGEVAQQLKFAPRQLEALEQEKFDQLPGGTFVRGMLRSYARLLKLDPEPLVDTVAGRFAAPDANHLAARYSQPVPFSDNARRSTFVYLGLSVGVLAIAGGVAYEWYRDHSAPARMAALQRPAQSAPALAQAPVPPPQPQPKVAEAPAQPKADLPKMAKADAPKVAKLDAPKAAREPEKTQLVAADKAPPPAPAKLAPGLNRLVIQCEEEAWIEVKDANDRMLVSSLNPPGAERVVQARGPLTLVIGNAAHVRVLHNDRPIDLGPHTKLAIARFTLP